ncbi:MAG: hypothetical protein ACPLRH_05345 [Desulfotomaculales bacterium]
MLFRNAALVISVYAFFEGIAFRALTWRELPAFTFMALFGVLWALCDAVDLAGVKKRALAIWAGFAVSLAVSGWFLLFSLGLRMAKAG